MKTYFNIPTQVLFWDYLNDCYSAGIAYKNEIICGCCGSVFEICEIIYFTPDIYPPIWEVDWKDLTDCIDETAGG